MFFIDGHVHVCLKSRNNSKNNVSIPVCQEILFSQEEQKESQREYILFFFLKKKKKKKRTAK